MTGMIEIGDRTMCRNEMERFAMLPTSFLDFLQALV